MNLHSTRRNDEIEVLRAIAVLIVIIGHGGALFGWPLPPFAGVLGFFGGVDLFFVISGYVITSAYADAFSGAGAQAERTGYWRQVGAFWIRRFFRITPTAWLWLSIVLVLSLVFNRMALFGGARGNLGDFVSVALTLANFHAAKCATPEIWCGSNGVYWSISLEEQFYLAFPFLFLLPRRIMVAALLAVVAVYLFVPRTTLVWLTRIDGICLGVLLAFFQRSQVHGLFAPRVLAHALPRVVVGAGLVASLLIVPGGTGLVTFFPSVVVAVSGALVLIASHDKGYLMAAGQARNALVWVGGRSFALYLMHNPVFWFIRETQGRMGGDPLPPACLVGIAAVMMAVLAELNFRMFETPIRTYGKEVAARFAQGTP
jgi:peptidoglycan/LPS O-acetylase OafA/YrhL